MKLKKLDFFLSQHLANHVALAIRDVATSEKLLVQGNIFKTDKYIKGNYNPPFPTAAALNHHISKSSHALTRGNDLAQQKLIGAIVHERAVAIAQQFAVSPRQNGAPFSFRLKHEVAAIGIGGSLAAPPLPHHRAYGSVHGGSRSCANTIETRMAGRAI